MDAGGAGFLSPLPRDLILEKERRSHYTNTNKSDKQNVRYKIGESKKYNTANQCNSVLLFPAIYKVTHTD